MNNNPRHGKPAGHGAHRPHAHHAGGERGHNHQQHGSGHIARAKPPSQSQAPWDITKWIDPIQNSRTQKTK